MKTFFFIVAVWACLSLVCARSSRKQDDPNDVNDDKRSSSSRIRPVQYNPPSQIHIQPVYYPVYTVRPPMYVQPQVPNFSYPQASPQSFNQPRHSHYMTSGYYTPQPITNFNRHPVQTAQPFPMSNNPVQMQAGNNFGSQLAAPPAASSAPMSTSGMPRRQPDPLMNFFSRFTPMFFPGQPIRNDPRFPAGGIVTKTDGFGEANVLTPMGMAEVDGFEVSYDMGF